jgi:hypothetical protein
MVASEGVPLFHTPLPPSINSLVASTHTVLAPVIAPAAGLTDIVLTARQPDCV